ncbi:DUF4387 family protein [Paraburkholderia heleia]|uniref:DUF4387 family protein n=1 Tax=Paraburkholderia heleia TaxID=634127 RepID=UPI0031D36425
MKDVSTTGYYVRSKNAGPFWLTIDIFCNDRTVFDRLCKDARLAGSSIAQLLKSDETGVKVFHLDRLNVIKISLPRPVIQGSIFDRDMHGAQWACLIQERLANQ